MEWYEIVLVVMVVALPLFLFFAKKKGWINADNMTVITEITKKLEEISKDIANKKNEPVYDIANLIITFVNKAVLAAENAWYHDEISKDERKEYSLKLMGQLFEAFEIVLSLEQWNTIDVLITAACEEMGHEKTKE